MRTLTTAVLFGLLAFFPILHAEESATPAEAPEATPEKKLEEKFVGTWRGKTKYKEEGFHQVYRWWLVRRADGTYSLKMIEEYPDLKVYVLDGDEGRWELKGRTYIEYPPDDDPVEWKIEEVKEDRISLRMDYGDEDFSEELDIDERQPDDAEVADFLEPTEGYREVTYDELDQLLE